MYKAPVKRIQHFTEQLPTFANLRSFALLSAVQFVVVKRTKHFGQHFLSFVGTYAVLHKDLKEENAMRRLGMCEFNDHANVFDRHQTRQSSTEQHRAITSSTEQHRAAPSSNEQYRAAPSSTEQHRARLNNWSNEYNILPSRNVERCSVKCSFRLTGA